jgi:hypothetical protein
MPELITIKGIKYVVVDRKPTGIYQVGRPIASLLARKQRGAVYFEITEIRTATGIEHVIVGRG